MRQRITIRSVQGVAWVPEYSGTDCTWKTWRSAVVITKRRIHARPQG